MIGLVATDLSLPFLSNATISFMQTFSLNSQGLTES